MSRLGPSSTFVSLAQLSALSFQGGGRNKRRLFLSFYEPHNLFSTKLDKFNASTLSSES